MHLQKNLNPISNIFKTIFKDTQYSITEKSFRNILFYIEWTKIGKFRSMCIIFEMLKYTNPPFPPGVLAMKTPTPGGFQTTSPTPIPHPRGIPRGPHFPQPRGANTTSACLYTNDRIRFQIRGFDHAPKLTPCVSPVYA